MILAAGDTATLLTWLGVLAGGVIMTGLYCGLETGIYVINKFRLDLRAESQDRPARRLKGIVDNYGNLLAVLLIGTNVAAYAATFALSAMFDLGGAGDDTEWYTIAAATPILFIFGESVPKNIFQRLAERIVYRLSWFLRVSSIFFNACGVCPLVRGFSWLLTRLIPGRDKGGFHAHHEGLAAIVAEGRAGGVLTHFQSVMADRIMQIGQVHLSDVMVPLGAAVSVPHQVGRDELVDIIRSHNYSRLPMLDDAGGAVAILDVYRVLQDTSAAAPAQLATEPMVLPAQAGVTDALYRMQRLSATMAVVEDADGKHVGIVTIKDLVEEIVGELEAW